ncbi:MAG: TagF domain-containing protein, partial [Ramlibacter sp.]
GVPTGQLGVFAPSCDRVGRVFPFVVAAPLVPDQQTMLLDRAALLGLAWSQVIIQAQENRLGVEAVDAGLQAALADTLSAEEVHEEDEGATLPLGLDPSSLPWPEVRHSFDLQGSESYWWSVPPASTGFQSRTHSGPLRTAHFLDLCR